MTKQVPIYGEKGKGLYALVSDHRYEDVMKYRWTAYFSDNTWYAKTKIRLENGKRYDLKMHRYILGLTDPKIFGEHINGNGWDNTDENLRPSTTGENQRNRGANKNSTSKYKGVSWNSAYKKWFARIAVDNREIFIGVFDNEEEAAISVDTFTRKYHGEFARLNFPDIEWSEQQVMSARYFRSTQTGFIGVVKNGSGYVAKINVNKEQKYLGWFKDPVEAAKVRDAAVVKYGLKRRLNFPEDYPDYVAS